MKPHRLILALVLLVILTFVCVWLFTTAFAQIVAPAPCVESAPCLRQRLKDLTDYREFLEDQLALAKALNSDLQGQLGACRAALPPTQEPKPGDR